MRLDLLRVRALKSKLSDEARVGRSNQVRGCIEEEVNGGVKMSYGGVLLWRLMDFSKHVVCIIPVRASRWARLASE